MFTAAGVGLALAMFSLLDRHASFEAAATTAGFLDRGGNTSENAKDTNPSAF